MQITTEWVLEQAQESEPPMRFINTDILRERLGIPKDPANNDWIGLCSKVYRMYKDGLLEFSNNTKQIMGLYADNANNELFMYNNVIIGAQFYPSDKGEQRLIELKAQKIPKINQSVQQVGTVQNIGQANTQININSPNTNMQVGSGSNGSSAISNIMQGIIATVIGGLILFFITTKSNAVVLGITNTVQNITLSLGAYVAWAIIVLLGIIAVISFIAMRAYVVYVMSSKNRKYNLPKLVRYIGGIILIVVGGFIIIYGAQIWQSSYQIKNVSNPNFLLDAAISSIETIEMYVIGVLFVIGGGILINTEVTLKLMVYIHENYTSKMIE